MYKGTCLYDIITVRGICTPGSNSLFINDLPGVSSQKFELLTSSDDSTAVDLWQKIQREAVNSFYHKVRGGLANKFQLKTLQGKTNASSWTQPFIEQAAEDKLRGTIIDLRGSDYLEATIHSIGYYSQGAIVSPAFYVIDLETGVTIDTLTANEVTAAGFYTLTVNKSYPGKRLFICYDASIILSREAEYLPLSYYMDCNSCYSCASCAEVDKNITPIYDNLQTNCRGGMLLSYSVGCSLDQWLCENQDNLATPLLYHVAKRFFLEVLASDRINRATLMPTEEYDKLVAYCEEEAAESLSSFIDGVVIEDTLCFVCKAKARKKVTIP